MMNLIADSGSTKTSWVLFSEDSSPLFIHTQGINPIHQDEETVKGILQKELMPQLSGRTIDEIFFYGSGVRPTEEALMQRLLQEVTGVSRVEAKSDLLGAARALCGHDEGLACILGTGSNSCLFDGHRIVMNTSPLGYILGDEGSGAVLGIKLLNALYKGMLPDTVLRDFEEEQGVTLADIINRVYRQPLANRYLASLSPFVHSHLHLSSISELVVNNFQEFIRRNVVPYGRRDLPLSAVGSVAFYYREQLQMAVEREGFVLGNIEQSPLQRLMSYHSLTRS
jgi:N-acetylglucosamine kinase-like BadF-type ATPase